MTSGNSRTRRSRRFPLLVALAATLASLFVAAATRVGAATPRPAAPSRGDALVELGRRLFFDPAVSRSGDNSCASCHEPDHGFSSRERINDDDFLRTRRHSQPLLDLAGGHAFHWDGEFDTVSELVASRLGEPSGTPGRFSRPTSASSGYGSSPATPDPRPVSFPSPTSAPREVTPSASNSGGDSRPTTPSDARSAPSPAGTSSSSSSASTTPATPSPSTAPVTSSSAPPPTPAVVGRLAHAGVGKGGVGAVANRVEADGRYGEAFRAAYGTSDVTTARLADAITAFVESIRSTTSPYDRFAAGDTTQLDEPARRGFLLFKGRAGCAQCHLLTAGHAPFTDQDFHNTGIARRAVDRATNPADALARKSREDRGHQFSTTVGAQMGQFKTPTLRDVALRAPYMHDGSFESLEQVVRFYANGAHANEGLDRRIRAFDASTEDVNDLVAFLRSLSGSVRPGRAPDFGARVAQTTVRLLDAAGRPLAGLEVTLEGVGDRLPGASFEPESARVVRTDERGRLEFAPSKRTHTKVSLPGGLRSPQGAWIPDTCASLEWRLPVEGRASLLLVLERGAAVAPRLGADVRTRAFPDALRRLFLIVSDKTFFDARHRVGTYELVGSAEVAGKTYARYLAWVPTDAPSRVSLLLPTPTGRTERETGFLPNQETRIDLTAGVTPR